MAVRAKVEKLDDALLAWHEGARRLGLDVGSLHWNEAEHRPDVVTWRTADLHLTCCYNTLGLATREAAFARQDWPEPTEAGMLARQKWLTETAKAQFVVTVGTFDARRVWERRRALWLHVDGLEFLQYGGTCASFWTQRSSLIALFKGRSGTIGVGTQLEVATPANLDGVMRTLRSVLYGQATPANGGRKNQRFERLIWDLGGRFAWGL